jgi:hypothetical protein
MPRRSAMPGRDLAAPHPGRSDTLLDLGPARLAPLDQVDGTAGTFDRREQVDGGLLRH